MVLINCIIILKDWGKVYQKNFSRVGITAHHKTLYFFFSIYEMHSKILWDYKFIILNFVLGFSGCNSPNDWSNWDTETENWTFFGPMGTCWSLWIKGWSIVVMQIILELMLVGWKSHKYFIWITFNFIFLLTINVRSK